LSDAKNIMAAYVDHYKELSKHGFTLGRNAHKLRFLERALENHADADEVYKRAANSTFREFADWARGGDEEEVPLSKIRVAGNKIFVGKTLAVTLAEELDPKTKAYFANINAEAGRALEAGEVILPVRLYDMDELKRFERAADKLKKELRVNYKGRR
jgi:hypothetical protein